MESKRMDSILDELRLSSPSDLLFRSCCRLNADKHTTGVALGPPFPPHSTKELGACNSFDEWGWKNFLPLACESERFLA